MKKEKKLSDLSPEIIDEVYSIYREMVGHTGAKLIEFDAESDLDLLKSKLKDLKSYLLHKEIVALSKIKTEKND